MQRRRRSRKSVTLMPSFVTLPELTIGDAVVHEDHGG